MQIYVGVYIMKVNTVLLSCQKGFYKKKMIGGRDRYLLPLHTSKFNCIDN